MDKYRLIAKSSSRESVYNFWAEIEIFPINLVNSMADDYLAHFVAKASAAMLDKSVLFFHMETLLPDT